MKTKDAIEHFGGIKDLAAKLEIWPQSIYRWGENVPEMMAYKIQVLSDNKLKAKDDD